MARGPGRPRAATPANIESVTKREAARLLALSERTVERLVDAGQLDAWRSGRAVRIWLRSVLAYQEANRVGSVVGNGKHLPEGPADRDR